MKGSSALVVSAILLATPLAAQRSVTFPTVDGGVVDADEYGAGPRGVVLAHGGRLDKRSWAPQARLIAEAGFRVVAINFRGRGDSRAGSTLEPGDEGLRFDVLGAVRYLRRSGATAVTVVGASFGGGAAAEASVAAEAGEINGQILLAHSAIGRPEKLKGKTLFIVSRGDPQADGTPRLVSIRDQFRRAPEPKRLVALRGSAHAQFIFDTPQSKRLLQEILAFLKAQ